MAANSAIQTYVSLEDSAQYPAYRVVQGAADGDRELADFVAGRPIASAQATVTSVAADTVIFQFPALTLAGLNLAAGESRTIKARIRSSGALVTANSGAYSNASFANIGGTLTAPAVSSVYGTSGVVTVTVAWAVASLAVQLTVTVPATVTAANYFCDVFFDGPKSN